MGTSFDTKTVFYKHKMDIHAQPYSQVHGHFSETKYATEQPEITVLSNAHSHNILLTVATEFADNGSL